MRFSALVPVVFGLAAFILSMLCIFAGSKKGFMEDYAIVTLNTSRIGSEVFNTTSSSEPDDNVFESFFHNLTNSIENEINEGLSSLAEDLGLHDFYSAHLLDYCEGYYTPTAVANATVKASAIEQNVTGCSNRTAFFHFNPTAALQTELNKTGLDVNLTDLHWPEDDVNKGFKAIRVVQKASFLLYCIAAGLLIVATIFSLLSVFFNGRLSALINIMLWMLSFLAILLASALITAVATKASSTINKYGDKVSVSAKKGNKFLVLTWVATGLTFLNVAIWCVECVLGRRRNVKHSYGEK